jgi:hypothetical protein
MTLNLTYSQHVEEYTAPDGGIDILTRTVWNDGAEFITPSPDQAALGIVGIMLETFDCEYCEIMQGETCPL